MKYLSLLICFFLFSKSSSQISKSSAKPLSAINLENSKTELTTLLDEKKWNELFPNRFGLKNKNDFYSFKSFVKAAKYFPEFLKGNAETQKRELSAFLANISQETSGGWPQAPGGYFKWGLYFREEQQTGVQNFYIDFSKKDYLPVQNKQYFGRGPKQLSWNYNYGQFSEAWFGSKDILLKNPDLLSEDSVLSFASAIWFWMTPQFPKPSCHDIMTGKWIPTDKDLNSGQSAGFGATVNVINGGVECGNGKDLDKTKYRYEYYIFFCDYFKVTPGENISCADQKPFGT